MENGNGNFCIVITESAILIEHLVDETPWDVTKKILAAHSTSLVEVITFPEREGQPGICGLIAEEGKINELYHNRIATRFFRKAFGIPSGDWIAGPMVICLNDSGLSGLPISQECLCYAVQLLGDFYNAKVAESLTS